MTLLKNRKFAIIITVIVVIFATLFGVGRSLNRLVRNVEKMFFEGVILEDAGFTQPPVDRHLEVIAQTSLDVSSIFAGHEDLSNEAEALMMARRNLIGARTIPEKYNAYIEIKLAGIHFITKADSIDLSGRDKESFDSFRSTFEGAVTAIQNSEYNVKAKGFMDGASIITYLLKPFVFVSSPQAFDT